MKREIKFRAWLTGINKMSYAHTIPEWVDIAAKDPLVQGVVYLQFTGMKDRNSLRIYEGDILDLSDGPAKVVYVDGRASYEVIFSDEANLGLWEACGCGRDLPRVIGNIYENPELLADF